MCIYMYHKYKVIFQYMLHFNIFQNISLFVFGMPPMIYGSTQKYIEID